MAISICDAINALRRTNLEPAQILDAVYEIARDRDEENAEIRERNRKRKRKQREEFGRDKISKSTREDVFDADNYKCTYCGSSEFLQIDHVIPLSKGGTNDRENLTTACRSCNLSKGNKLLEEWCR